MSLAIEQYLDRVMTYANRCDDEARTLRAEIQDHLQTKAAELEAQGLPREDAIFKAIQSHGNAAVVGYGLRPKFAWVDIRLRGTARGVIAIGPRAIGVVACGGTAIGVVAYGGLAVGVWSTGGLALALVLAWGGFAIAPFGIAFGGFALGAVAMGGFALGLAANGNFVAALLSDTQHAGVTVVSYYTPETAPRFLLWMYRVATSRAIILGLSAIPAIMVFPFTILQVLGFSRERRRMFQADPTLAD